MILRNWKSKNKFNRNLQINYKQAIKKFRKKQYIMNRSSNLIFFKSKKANLFINSKFLCDQNRRISLQKNH